MNKTLLCLSMLATVSVATAASAQAPVTDDELALGQAKCHANKQLVVPKTDADRQAWENCMAINAEVAKRYNAKRSQEGTSNSDIVNRLKKQ